MTPPTYGKSFVRVICTGEERERESEGGSLCASLCIGVCLLVFYVVLFPCPRCSRRPPPPRPRRGFYDGQKRKPRDIDDFFLRRVVEGCGQRWWVHGELARRQGEGEFRAVEGRNGRAEMVENGCFSLSLFLSPSLSLSFSFVLPPRLSRTHFCYVLEGCVLFLLFPQYREAIRYTKITTVTIGCSPSIFFYS